MEKSNSKKSIGIFIPCYNGEKHLSGLLPLIDKEKYKLFIIDSSSGIKTSELLEKLNVYYERISQKNFNHGSIREYARKKLNTDIIVMLTQDIMPLNENFIDLLINPLLNDEAEVCYGRQLARENAGLFESFPREFNYPTISNIRSIKDVNQYGVYTFFCSDSFAAYKNSALEEVGGFTPTLTWEDYFAVAKLLQHGYRIYYVAEATVIHSHKYSLVDEFKRYFDAGYVRAENKLIDKIIASSEQRGIEYFRLLLEKINKSNKSLIPFAVLNTLVKWLGFRTGYYSLRMPKWWNKQLSGQKYYWDSKYYKKVI